MLEPEKRPEFHPVYNKGSTVPRQLKTNMITENLSDHLTPQNQQYCSSSPSFDHFGTDLMKSLRFYCLDSLLTSPKPSCCSGRAADTGIKLSSLHLARYVLPCVDQFLWSQRQRTCLTMCLRREELPLVKNESLLAFSSALVHTIPYTELPAVVENFRQRRPAFEVKISVSLSFASFTASFAISAILSWSNNNNNNKLKI